MPNKLSTEETVLLSAKVPASLVKQVDSFKKRAKLSSRSEAMRVLLDQALGNEHNLPTNGAQQTTRKPAAKKRVATAAVDKNVSCAHPVSRRIGTQCAACGASVK